MPNAGEVGRQSSGFLREKALRSEEKDSGMKYLIMEDFAGQPVSFVFPRRVDHGDMREQLPYAELDIVARPEDEAILMEAFQKAE